MKSLSISLTPRDLVFLRCLFESRIMTTKHASTLCFGGKPDATKKRLQKLKSAGLIGERRRKVYEPSILFLTRKAHLILEGQGILSEYPTLAPASLERRSQVSELTLRHELEIMDVKAAFHLATKTASKFTLAEFSTWPLLYQFKAFRPGGSEVIVKPDGLIRIHETESDGGKSEHTFFLELDRSSETQDTLVSRASCYLEYFKSGGFAERCGAMRSEFKDYPFRVLMIFKTAERRNNTAERLLQSIPPILTQVCMTTLPEAISNPFGEIWMRPVDFREITEGTPFDVSRNIQRFGYQRQTERERFVEGKIKKLSILS
jgi:hypothetical protein